METDTPVEPFGATVAGAWALVPEARLYDGPMPPPAGTYAVTVPQVDAWVREVSGAVAMRLTGWQGLNDEPVAPETTSDRDQLIEYARTVIHNGAASYLEAARHPERSSVNTESYSAVLWQRYRDGLEDLAGWIEKRLTAPEAGDELPVDGAGGPIGSFPVPLFGDGVRF